MGFWLTAGKEAVLSLKSLFTSEVMDLAPLEAPLESRGVFPILSPVGAR